MQTNTTLQPMSLVTKVRIMELITDEGFQKAYPKLADKILATLLEAERKTGSVDAWAGII